MKHFWIQNFGEQYDLLYEMINRGAFRVLAKLVYFFDLTQKNLKEIEAKASAALNSYFAALREQELASRETKYSRKVSFICRAVAWLNVGTA